MKASLRFCLGLLAVAGLPLAAEEPIAPSDLAPAALSVDGSPAGNEMLEPGETVVVAPSWRNTTAGPVTATGAASAFVGPGAPGLYSITDGVASYGTLAAGQAGSCLATGDCYRLSVGTPAVRPEAHWDATFGEATSTSSLKTWMLHIGDSFTDVPRANLFYRFVEALLHHGVTGGCAPEMYCPASPITREQLSVFAVTAKEGRFFVPRACTLGTEMFSDVPATSPFCRFVEELARRGVVGGCGNGQYCPGAPVSREQMAVFMLSTKEGTGYAPPACVAGNEFFDDVPAASPFCRWIEELARRSVVAGCGGGSYCPTATVTREQMSVFITRTFGLSAYGVPPYMYLVNSADDANDGACSPSHCSLREALTAANSTPNPGAREEIRFAIPGPGPHVIRPALPLTITEAVAVDGYSQPGTTPNNLAAGSNAVLKIELDLSASEAIRVSGSDTLLRGLALNRSTWRAIALDGGNHAVEGCFIGTDAAGTLALANLTGIQVHEFSGQNRIGGTSPSQRNLVSGNTDYGIAIHGSSNLVQGNLVGTDRAGTAAIPNGLGVLISAAFVLGSNTNVIGGLEQGAGNVISGNSGADVTVTGYIGASVRPAANNRIQANLIGVAVDGSLLPSPRGITVVGNGVSGTLIGGDSIAPAGNSIASVIAGVYFGSNVGPPITTSVRGNLIRGGQHGVYGVPNGGDITANVIGPSSGSGVFLDDVFGLFGRMTIRGNSISGHGVLGIDLAPAGVTPNDPLDADAGPNGLQNFPVITSAVRSGNSLAITGSLASTPGASYVVELFASAAANPSGHGEGAASLGTISVTTDGAGTAPISVVLPTTVPAGHVITATATNGAGNTSEFSSARPVQ